MDNKTTPDGRKSVELRMYINKLYRDNKSLSLDEWDTIHNLITDVVVEEWNNGYSKAMNIYKELI